MTDSTAQTKMKALVVSRLLLGDINDWRTFEQERETAAKILNRRAARSVSSQIGRSYHDLSTETQKFILKNFDRCDYKELARLCDAVKPGIGLYLRLGEFEKLFFALAESVKRRFPFYAHVSISTFGLQFEFPEHHFWNDMDAAFEDLKETRQRIYDLAVTDANMKGKRNDIAPLLSTRECTKAVAYVGSPALRGLFARSGFMIVVPARLASLSRRRPGRVRYGTKPWPVWGSSP